MNILGIDIGTTGICAVVLNSESGTVVETVSEPNRSFVESSSDFEKIQDTAVIYDTVLCILSRIKSDYGCIGLSGQMHGIVYTDKNGNAVSPLFTWQDGRGGKLYIDGKTYAGFLGSFPGYGLTTALYNEVNNLVPGEAEYICTIADYIAMKLCGNTKPVMHITCAASLGCFDFETNRFSVDNKMLADVTSDFTIIGKTAAGIPVCAAIGDNQASFIGSVPSEDGILLNIGTGAQISYLKDTPESNENAEIRPFDGKRFLVAGCSLCGGRSFAMLERFCREIALAAGAEISSYYPVLDKLLSEEYDYSVTADCRFCGTRSDSDIKGSFSDITESTFNIREFAFSVLDGIVRELYEMYIPVKKSDCLVCSGNGFRKNPVLKNMVRKYFGVSPLETVYDEEAAVGAAFCAGVACGVYDNIDTARKSIILSE